MSDEILSENEFTAGDNFFGQMIEAGVADQQFIRDIVEMFIEEGQVSLDILTTSIKNKDLANIQLYAHKLKSSFLMFDMHEAHSIAVKLEKLEADELFEAASLFSVLQINCNENFRKLKKKYLGG